jgi:hypothetical protein
LHDLPLNKPDWDIWEKADVVELHDALALSLDMDPRELWAAWKNDHRQVSALQGDQRRNLSNRIKLSETHLGRALEVVGSVDLDKYPSVAHRVSLTKFAEFAKQMDWTLPPRFPKPSPSPDWDEFRGRKWITCTQAAALSLGMRLDYTESHEGMPYAGTQESSVQEFHRRLRIILGHIKDGTILSRRTTSEFLEGLVGTDEVEVTSFRKMAATKGWPLPSEFPGEAPQVATAAAPQPATTTEGPNTSNAVGAPGVVVHLPHMTKTLEAVFQVMRDNWTDFDPKNLPKQGNIGAEIDEALGWSPQASGEPSRGAQTLAAAIRPDDLAEVDGRRELGRKRKT